MYPSVFHWQSSVAGGSAFVLQRGKVYLLWCLWLFVGFSGMVDSFGLWEMLVAAGCVLVGLAPCFIVPIPALPPLQNELQFSPPLFAWWPLQ